MVLPALGGWAGWTLAVTVSTVVYRLLNGEAGWAPGACERVEPYLGGQLVGQELALRQLADAVCDHLADPHPRKPLVLSAHGPPGVGKSLSHQLLARVLYRQHPADDLACPGHDCPAYKVLYGMDYLAAERDAQVAYLRGAVLEHVRGQPQALLVVEEYDKLDCAMRPLVRQLLEGAPSANVSLNRAIIMLESNTGYTQLHQMLQAAGSREKVSPEAAQKVLKDMVFSRWLAGRCEERADTLKMTSLIDFYLPFLPLERRHIRQLFALRLRERAARLRAEQGAELAHDDAVLDFLTDKVDFEGDSPIEGAKEVATLLTRYVSRALRDWAHSRHAPASAPGVSAGSPWHAAKAFTKKARSKVSSKVKSMVEKVASHSREEPPSANADKPPVARVRLRVSPTAINSLEVIAR